MNRIGELWGSMPPVLRLLFVIVTISGFVALARVGLNSYFPSSGLVADIVLLAVLAIVSFPLAFPKTFKKITSGKKNEGGSNKG